MVEPSQDINSATLGLDDPEMSGQLIGQPQVGELVPGLVIVVILSMSNLSGHSTQLLSITLWSSCSLQVLDLG